MTIVSEPEPGVATASAEQVRQPLVEALVVEQILLPTGVSLPPGETVHASVTRILGGSHWLAGGVIRTPIHVRLVGEEGLLLVVHDQTGIVGVGADLSSAIVDFRGALVEHKDVLLASQPLSPDLEEQLELLRRTLSD